MIAGRRFASTALAALMLAVPLAMRPSPAHSQAGPDQLARGKYLVQFGGCNCHTPGVLAPIMPWRAFATLTRGDADAIAAYLKSLAPIANRVPGPFAPSDKPTSFVMKVVPPGQ